MGLMRLYALSGRREKRWRSTSGSGRLSQGAGHGAERLDPRPQGGDSGRQVPADPYRSPLAPAEGNVSRSAGKHNLPAPRTSFVGREREMLEVKRDLAMTRLLTLTGAGGSGKTRLALEVASDLVGAYPDGVWLVELAPLSEGALVPQAVAAGPGGAGAARPSLTDTLVEALRAKEMLLVLDNCEHLVEAAARLVDVLLDSCPRLRVLATSREALSVAGELRWPVPAPLRARPAAIAHGRRSSQATSRCGCSWSGPGSAIPPSR